MVEVEDIKVVDIRNSDEDLPKARVAGQSATETGKSPNVSYLATMNNGPLGESITSGRNYSKSFLEVDQSKYETKSGLARYGAEDHLNLNEVSSHIGDGNGGRSNMVQT